MKKDNLRVYFTKEDSAGLKILEYTPEEVKKSKTTFFKWLFFKLVILLAIFILLAFLMLLLESDAVYFFSRVGQIGIIFLAILIVKSDITNYKYETSGNYFEIIVDKIFPEIVESDGCVGEAGACNVRFWPVEGHDSSTNYKSLFYVAEDEYKQAKVNEKLKIKIYKNK